MKAGIEEAPQKKRKLNVVSLDTKLSALKYIESGQKLTEVSKKYYVPHNILSKWIKKQGENLTEH